MLKKMVLVGLVLLIALPLFSSQGEKQVYGMFQYTHHLRYGSHPGFGGGAFFLLGERYGAGFEFSYVPGVTPQDLQEYIDITEASGYEVSSSSRMMIINADFGYQFGDLDKSTIVPYFVAGPAVIIIYGRAEAPHVTYEPGGEEYITEAERSIFDYNLAAHFGGGIKLALGKNFFARADYRLLYCFEENWDRIHRVMIALGFLL